MFVTLALRRLAKLSGRGKPTLNLGLPVLPGLGARRGRVQQPLRFVGEPLSGGELTLVDGLDQLYQLGVGRAVGQQEVGGAMYLVHRSEVAVVRLYRVIALQSLVILQELLAGLG